jgi:hypothetical protein
MIWMDISQKTIWRCPKKWKKKSSTLLVFREIQIIKNTMRYHPTIVKMKDKNKQWWGCKIKRNSYVMLVGKETHTAIMENRILATHKTKNRTTIW